MIEIRPQNQIFSEAVVPGSKSYTHRMLIATALSNGPCMITNALKSEDTILTLAALRQMGVDITEQGTTVFVSGTSGKLKTRENPIYLGNSGTSMRLLAAVAAIADGVTTLTGTNRMHERPIDDLLDGLHQLGVPAVSIYKNGCPPIEITGGKIIGGKVSLNCSISSQYLSALLLIAPYTQNGVEITVTEGPVSKPYIDMTIDVMSKLGVEIERKGYNFFKIMGSQMYQCGNYTVESDVSNASYFWAAAAITGGSVKVKGISLSSKQGDIQLTKIFEQMGCKVYQDIDGVVVSGKIDDTGMPILLPIDADMADMPDMVPTLAVVAAFAKGTSVIRNVAHLKAKESNRLSAVATELTKMGVDVSCSQTGLTIKGGIPHGAVIDTYNDHRIAMSFAVAGLRTPGVFIRNETCVEKSFPNFWDVFFKMSHPKG